MRRWFWKLPSWAQRTVFVAGALVSFGAAASMVWPHHHGSFIYGYQVFLLASSGAYFLGRAFGGDRFKGLSGAAKRLGIPYDVGTATAQGRVRGVFVRVVPERGGKVVAYAPDGRGQTLKRMQKNDPIRGTSEHKIADAIEMLVGEVESVQKGLCAWATGPGNVDGRRSAIRELATIPPGERIPCVDEMLAASARDDDPRVRLTATFALGRVECEEATALAVLAEKRPETTREAAAALAIVGTAAALGPLVAAHHLAPAAVDAAVSAIRSRTGVEAGGLALSDAAAADGALSIAQRAEGARASKR